MRIVPQIFKVLEIKSNENDEYIDYSKKFMLDKKQDSYIEETQSASKDK